jgi:hypothetical protein
VYPPLRRSEKHTGGTTRRGTFVRGLTPMGCLNLSPG